MCFLKNLLSLKILPYNNGNKRALRTYGGSENVEMVERYKLTILLCRFYTEIRSI